tara:strand:- start:195 stop:1196 length:1002 start_codon:yes stop_codon:yes gene_type:complete
VAAFHLRIDFYCSDKRGHFFGRQVQTDFGTFIDLLAINSEGNLSIIELKRHKTPREVFAQAIDYASWADSPSYGKITDIYAELVNGKEFEQAFEDSFGTNPPEKLNESLQNLIVAAELDNASERIINYLSDNYGVPINAVFFRYFRDGENEYLSRSWLIDPKQAEVKTSLSSPKKGKETWNGRDFYVSFGEDERRDWDDAKKYGFVCAGGGRWYSRTLEQLFVGARIFVNIPATGYVAVGTVLEESMPIKDFKVEVDGESIPFLEAPRKAHNPGVEADDSELSEYVVRVEWIKTLDRNQAYKEKGLFGNQNTVTKLRNRFTLEKLIKHFGLDD